MNKWIKYIDRNFSSIVASVQRQLDVNTPELTDRSTSNLLMVIVDIFAGVGEMINYYIDTTARELYLSTARRFSSLLKLATLANYQGKARSASYSTVVFTAKDGSDEILEAPTEFTIPLGTILNDERGFSWLTLQAQVFRKGYRSIQVDVVQVDPSSAYSMGISDGSIDQMFVLPTNYRHGSSSISVAASPWAFRESMGFSSPTEQHFTITMELDGAIYVRFGDGVNGKIPTSGLEITAYIQTTEGVNGNADKGTIKTIVSALTTPGVDHLDVTNNNRASGGRAIEGIEELRRAIPLSLRTLSRAVTKQDYEDTAILNSDVRAARASFDCGIGVDLFIVSHGGGNVPQAILDEIKVYVENRAMMNVPVRTFPSGETIVKGYASITSRFRVPLDVLNLLVEEALVELYNPFVSKINQAVRLSDIIAAIDGIDEVDFLTIDWIYAMPFLRPSNPAYTLDYSITVLEASSTRTEWTMVYDQVTDPAKPFIISKGSIFQVKMAHSSTESDVGGLLDITIGDLPGSIAQGDSWAFIVYPFNKDIELDDLSIPIINPGDFVLDITQKYL